MRALVSCVLCLVLFGLQARSGPSDPEALPRDGAALARAQAFVRFEENRGQIAAQADYVARTSGYTVFLAGGDAVFAVASAPRSNTRSRDVAYLTMAFVGTSHHASPVAERELPSRSHYLIGRDPAGWTTNVRHYARVRYREIYPGIDVVYHGGTMLEYDLIVQPFANPAPIRLRLDGAQALREGSAGSLVATIATGRIVLRAPRIYQDIAGARRSVAGRFRLVDSSEVRVDLGDYDRTQALTIDPLMIVYSSYVGGAGSETATGIAVDGKGMAYVVGQTFSADFPVKNALQNAPASGEDAYVLKVDPAASGAASLIYATYLGSTERDGAEGIAVDTARRAYVTGATHAGDFPVTGDGFKPTWTPNPNPNDDESDAFAVILNEAGDGLVYGTYFGGTSDEEGMGIVPRGDSVFYLAGGTDGTSFPTTPSAFDATGQVRSAFLSVLNWRSNTLLYSTVYHADPQVQLQTRGLAVDASGRAHLTGLARGDGLPVKNAFMATFPSDASSSFGRLGSFLAVFDPFQSGGNSLVYATFLGAGDAEAVAVDSKGRSVVVGSTSSPTFPTTAGAFDTACEDLILANGANLGCQKDAFVMLFDPGLSGTASLVSASRLGGARSEDGNAVALDNNDDIIVTGSTNSAGFPAVEAISGATAHPDGETDAFVTKMSPTLSSVLFSTRFGGVTLSNGSTGAADVGRAIAVAPDGGACIAGTTSASDFPISHGFDASLGGFGDAFVAKLVLRKCRSVTVTTTPGTPFVWEPPLELCLVWDGNPAAPGTFPQRCPPSECPECGPSLSRTRGPSPMPAELARLYREAGAVLGGGGARPSRDRSTQEALLRAVRGVPNGQYFSATMKSRLTRALERPDRSALGQRLRRRQLTEAFNALELDWRMASAPSAAKADRSRPVDVGGLGTVRLTRGEGEVGIEVRSGLPALPRGVHTGWPLASYGVTSTSKLPAGTTAEVELYVGWISFGGGGETRLMSWNGKEYRDVTSGYDARRGLLRGTVHLGELVVVVRTFLCYGLVLPLRPLIRNSPAGEHSPGG